MTIEERLEKLETELVMAKKLIRNLIIGVGVVLLVCIVGLIERSIIGVAYGQGEKVIRANKFVVEDATGKERAVLSVAADGEPDLRMYGKQDKEGSLLTANSLNLWGENIRSTLLTIDMLMFLHKQGSIALTVSDNGPNLSLRDGQEGSTSLNTSGLFIEKNRGRTNTAVTLDSIALLDDQGKIRAGMFLQDKEPLISLYDKQGKPIWVAP